MGVIKERNKNMRKIIILVSSIIFLLMVINSYSQEQSPTPREDSQNWQNCTTKTDKNGNTHQECTQKEPLLIKEVASKVSKPDTNKQRQNIDQSSSAKDFVNIVSILLTAIATIAVAIFTFLLARYNKKMWETTNKVAEATKDAAGASIESVKSLPTIERAYLFIDSIEWPKGEAGFTLSEYNNLDLIKGMIKNVGRTPAILCNVSAKVSIKESEYPTREAVRGKSEIVFPKGVIIKSDGTEIFSCGEVIGPSIMTESEFSQSTILCYGYVIYEDIFGKSHETGFCYEFKPIYLEGRFHISNNKELNYHT